MTQDNKPVVVDEPEGKFEMSIRILGNELIAMKMVVDDFKMKWILVGLIAMVCILWAGSSFGPALVDTFSGGN
jgi:hypothetical protein